MSTQFDMMCNALNFVDEALAPGKSKTNQESIQDEASEPVVEENGNG